MECMLWNVCYAIKVNRIEDLEKELQLWNSRYGILNNVALDAWLSMHLPPSFPLVD